MTAHTPGPWKVYSERHPRHDGGYHTELTIGTACYHPQLKGPVPVVGLSWGMPEKDGEPWRPMIGMRSHDARLIAAAPDLLAALKSLMKSIHYDSGEELDAEENWAEYQSAMAAIAKAEGNQ